MVADRVNHKDWVVVTDGGRALVLRNDGDAQNILLTVLRTYEPHPPPTRDIGSDKPGRTHTSMRPGRSAMEPTDFHQQEEDRLMVEVAADLAEDRGQQNFSTRVGGAGTRARRTTRTPRAPGGGGGGGGGWGGVLASAIDSC